MISEFERIALLFSDFKPDDGFFVVVLCCLSVRLTLIISYSILLNENKHYFTRQIVYIDMRDRFS